MVDHDDPARYGRSFADVYDRWYRDAFDTETTVAAIARLAAGGSVLELGAGTGRLAIPLADRGIDVVALDASTEMLDRLRRGDRDGRVSTVLADMAAIDVEPSVCDRRFAVVVCACSSLLNLPDVGSIRRCIAGAAAVLAPGGALVLEAVVPTDPQHVPLVSLTPARVVTDGAVFVETRFDPDRRRLTGRHVEVVGGAVRTRPWAVVLCGPDVLDDAAAAAGLALDERWSDWSGSDFDDGAGEHVSIYRRRP